MKRVIIIAAAVLVVAIVGIFVFLYNNLDSIVEGAIEKSGSDVLGTGVHVGSVDISLKSGRGTIRDLSVDNPDGFSSADAFRLGEISLDIQVMSLNRDPIVIETVRITAPEVRAELDDRGNSNIWVIKNNLDKFQGGAKKSASSKQDAGYEKRFLIQSFRFEEGTVTADATALDRGSMEVKLPPVVLSNVGAPNGDTPEGIGKTVTRAFLGTVLNTVTKEMRNRAVSEMEDAAEDAATKELKKILK